MDLDINIDALARAQHGLVTRAQALRMGLSEAACEWRVSSGQWLIVHRGIYRLAGAPPTWEQSLKAACLLVKGVASHRAAGVLLGVPGLERRVEVTVLRRHTVEPVGVTVHQSRTLEWSDRDLVERIPVTSVARTVIDLASVLDRVRLEAVVDHVLATRKVPLEYLVRRLGALGTRGRPGTGELASFLRRRQGMAHFADSEPQRALLRAISKAGLPTPRVEFPVKLANGITVYADVAYPEGKLIIEVDSYLHHSTLTDWSKDHVRTGDLVELGWGVLPVRTVQLRDDPAGVAQKILRSLQSRRATSEVTSPASTKQSHRRTGRRPR